MESVQSNCGVLDVLNVGQGHLTFRFDRKDPAEASKAKTVIMDMLRRGYMLFVKVGGEQKRVRQFDPQTEEYILEEPEDLPGVSDTGDQDIREAADKPELAVGRRGPGRARGKRVAMQAGNATGIGPTAGG